MPLAAERDQLRTLLLSRSVERGEFTLASGRHSTFYIDARRTTMSGQGMMLIGALGLERLELRGWRPRLVGGLTLGADPVAYAIAAAAYRRGVAIDAFTVRKRPKAHGTAKRIEGARGANEPVLVVEDVVTTGQSAFEAIHAVEAEGGRVLGVLAVVDREEGGRAALEGAGYPADALFTASDLGLR